MPSPDLTAIREYVLPLLISPNTRELEKVFDDFLKNLALPGFREGNRLLVCMAIEIKHNLTPPNLIGDIIAEIAARKDNLPALKTVKQPEETLIYIFGNVIDEKSSSGQFKPKTISVLKEKIAKLVDIYIYLDYYASPAPNDSRSMTNEKSRSIKRARLLQHKKLTVKRTSFGKPPKSGEVVGVNFVTTLKELERADVHLDKPAYLANALGLDTNLLENGTEFVLLHFNHEFWQPTFQPCILTCNAWKLRANPFYLSHPPIEGWGLTFPANGDTNHAFKERVFLSFEEPQAKEFTIEIEYLGKLNKRIEYDDQSDLIIQEGLRRFEIDNKHPILFSSLK